MVKWVVSSRLTDFDFLSSPRLFLSSEIEAWLLTAVSNKMQVIDNMLIKGFN